MWAIYEVGPKEPPATFNYVTHPGCGLSSTSSVQDWIDYNLRRSEMNFGVTVTPADQFMTLYTCGDKYENVDSSESHLYVFLKLVQ